MWLFINWKLTCNQIWQCLCLAYLSFWSLFRSLFHLYHIFPLLSFLECTTVIYILLLCLLPVPLLFLLWYKLSWTIFWSHSSLPFSSVFFYYIFSPFPFIFSLLFTSSCSRDSTLFPLSYFPRTPFSLPHIITVAMVVQVHKIIPRWIYIYQD